jgi:C4-dicarboxylate transporter DctM subunit
MRRLGYDEQLAAGCIVSSSTLAFLIPPSLAFIIYGIITETSISALFIAGILPGILLAALFMITTRIIIARHPEKGPPGPKTTARTKVIELRHVWHVVALFVLVMGGIYAGIFDATEAGAVGAFGAVVITAATRKLTPRTFLSSLKDTAQVTGMLCIVIVGAFIFMRFLALSKVPWMLSEFIVGLNLPPVAIMAGIVLLYIILGMFMEVFAAIFLTVPIILPPLVAMGYDPIWFGVIVVLLINMGIITPPVGVATYMLSGLTGVPSSTIFRGAVPYLIATLVCVAILTIFPQIVLFLPGAM